MFRAVDSIKLTGQEFSYDHPILAMCTVIGAVAIFVGLLTRCLGKDPKEGRDYYGSSHGGGGGGYGHEKYSNGHALSGSRLD
jgi:hypothetical protein